jgi:hypothetical protein
MPGIRHMTAADLNAVVKIVALDHKDDYNRGFEEATNQLFGLAEASKY